MKILIVEDDELKHQHLEKFVRNLLPVNTTFVWKKSYQSGLQEITSNTYDLILLDMSMHIYEKTAEESGGSFETYAGRMILSEIDIHDIATKVIVVTGYDVYNDGKTLETLKIELKEEFGEFYIDTIYFIGSEDKWKLEITQLIKFHFSSLFENKIINTKIFILLVEDSNYKMEKVQNYILRIAPNSTITIANDQITALSYLEKEKFDLMLLDMQLPNRFGESELDKNGGGNLLIELEINEELKQPLKIVALTQYDELQNSVRENFPELGAIKFDSTSSKWKNTLYRTIKNLAKSKNEYKKIIYCEEQNDELYNAIGFPYIEFRGLKGGSRKVYEAAKFEKEQYALRDRDYLSINEINKLKAKYPNYFILDYYCFENYIYHPDNIEEYFNQTSLKFNKEEYIAEIANQKNSKLLQIAQDYKATRNYLDVTENNNRKEIKENHQLVFNALKSDSFETFYQYFDMKGTNKTKGFDKTCLKKYNLKQCELVKTNWFLKKISKVLEGIL